MVLWGKSKDKPTSERIEKDVAASTTTTDEQIPVKNETTNTNIQKQELVAIDGTKARSGDECV